MAEASSIPTERETANLLLILGALSNKALPSSPSLLDAECWQPVLLVLCQRTGLDTLKQQSALVRLVCPCRRATVVWSRVRMATILKTTHHTRSCCARIRDRCLAGLLHHALLTQTIASFLHLDPILSLTASTPTLWVVVQA